MGLGVVLVGEIGICVVVSFSCVMKCVVFFEVDEK